MALIVEDGTIVAGANSFASVSGADAYFASVSDSAWSALDTPAKESALIWGSAYVSNQQIYTYEGSKSTAAQTMPWPRSNAYYQPSGPDVPSSLIPPEIVMASIVAAGLASTASLPTQNSSAAPGAIETKRERIEGAVTVDYYHSTHGRTLSGIGGAAAIERWGHPDVTGLVFMLLDDDLFQIYGDKAIALRSRGVLIPGQPSPPAFGRGMFDRVATAEDQALAARAPGE